MGIKLVRFTTTALVLWAWAVLYRVGVLVEPVTIIAILMLASIAIEMGD